MKTPTKPTTPTTDTTKQQQQQTPLNVTALVQALISHPASNHFRELPSKKDYPDYYTTIKTPVSLKEILQKAYEGANIEHIKQLTIQMKDNAKIYNTEDSQVVKDVELLMQYFNVQLALTTKNQPVSKTEIKKFYNLLTTMKHPDNEKRLVAELFMQLPSPKDYPDYYKVTTKPIAFEDIGIKIDADAYDKYEDFETDVLLLIENAKHYNESDSEVYADAELLQKTLFKASGKEEALPDAVAEHEEVDMVKYNGEEWKAGDCCYMQAQDKKGLVSRPGKEKKPAMGMIRRLWKAQNGQEGLLINWFLHPEQTRHQASHKFYQNEVFRTTHFSNHPFAALDGRCWIMHVKDYLHGYPKGATQDDIFVCEARYGENQTTYKSINKQQWERMIPNYYGPANLVEWTTKPDMQKDYSEIGKAALAKLEQEKSESEARAKRGDPPIPKKERFKYSEATGMDSPIDSKPKRTYRKKGDKVDTNATGSPAVQTPGVVKATTSTGHSVRATQPNQTPRPALYTGQAGSVPRHGQRFPGASQNRHNAHGTHGHGGYRGVNMSASMHLPPAFSKLFRTDEQDRVMWFAAPPIDIVAREPITHSLQWLVNRKRKREAAAAAAEKEASERMDVDDPADIAPSSIQQPTKAEIDPTMRASVVEERLRLLTQQLLDDRHVLKVSLLSAQEGKISIST